MREILDNENSSQIKQKKNHIEKMPSQPACRALDMILGLKYKAYSN